MSERRFPPTRRKLDEARRRGLVAVSPVLLRAVALLAGVGALLICGPRLAGMLIALTRSLLERGAEAAPGAPMVALPWIQVWQTLLWGIVPLGLALLLAAFACGLVQTRARVTMGLATRNKIRESTWRALAFALVMALGALLVIDAERAAWAMVLTKGGTQLLVFTVKALGRVTLKLSCLLVILGVTDYVVRYLAWRRSLWMTREEVEQERREESGDPRMRSEQRRRHQALLAREKTVEVSEANLVLVGDGVAVALTMREGRPVILCRAEQLLAARLIELARRQHIPIYANDELALRLARLSPTESLPPSLAGSLNRVIEVYA